MKESLTYFVQPQFLQLRRKDNTTKFLIVFCPFCCLMQNVKPFSSSDSLAKVQEVASWLLEMNQDLLSGGSSSRRSRGPGGPAVRGNASSTTRAPQQAADEGDEDEHMNRVLEEEEQLQQRVKAANSLQIICLSCLSGYIVHHPPLSHCNVLSGSP